MIEKELKARIDLTLRKIGVRNYNYTNDYSQKGLYMFMKSPCIQNPLIKIIANTQGIKSRFLALFSPLNL